MRVLFDQGTPAPLRQALGEHAVSTVYELGWAELDNGRLLKTAQEGFDLLLTTDQNLQHQQTLSDIALAILEHPQSIRSVLSGLHLRVALSGCIDVLANTPASPSAPRLLRRAQNATSELSTLWCCRPPVGRGFNATSLR